jgi:hypothetical protein
MEKLEERRMEEGMEERRLWGIRGEERRGG